MFSFAHNKLQLISHCSRPVFIAIIPAANNHETIIVILEWVVYRNSGKKVTKMRIRYVWTSHSNHSIIFYLQTRVIHPFVASKSSCNDLENPGQFLRHFVHLHGENRRPKPTGGSQSAGQGLAIQDRCMVSFRILGLWFSFDWLCMVMYGYVRCLLVI